MLKLYYAPGTCSLACWIALEWSGLEYETVRVNYNDPEYRKINPLGMVPALEIGADRPMTQAGAILQYIANLVPEKDLGANEGLENIFEFDETALFLSADIHPSFWPFFNPQRYTISENSDTIEMARKSAPARIDANFKHLDDIIGDSNHLYQNKRTVLDALAFIFATWTKNLEKTYKDYPNVKRMVEHLKEDPAVQKVLTESNE
ncbi:glutathione S-transferase family protein [Facklamia miroungae]|uniref:Glutathione S-transferase n=1 Tax=Facklamia miroungae TaxID=120956 RepID=A0A1G7QDX9_9LACT|nr:glutathione S-transferase N-terminal domain-containing protein [Facklamia miroungae]SDF96751.1 glutathione S-transferase [Facklamia miroungae]